MALHGHTAIEMYDAKTGKLTDRIEKDNLVTGAVEEYLSAMLYRSIFVGNQQPYPVFDDLHENEDNSKRDFIKEYFGGVLVFDKVIDESRKVVTNDDVCHNIGFAGLRPANQYRINSGSFNSVESVFDKENKKYKFVWDFATSACNGDIASICLTNERVGWQGIVDVQPFPNEDVPSYSNFTKFIDLPSIITNDKIITNGQNSSGNKFTFSYNKIKNFGETIGTFGIGDSCYSYGSYNSFDGSFDLDFNSVKPTIPSDYYSNFFSTLGSSSFATELSTVAVWIFYKKATYDIKFRLIDFNLTYRDYSYNFSSLVDNIYTFMENAMTKNNIMENLYFCAISAFREAEHLFIFSATHNGKVRVYKVTDSGFTYTETDIKTTAYNNNYINACIEYLDIKLICLGYRYNYSSSIQFPTFIVLDDNYNTTDKYYINTHFVQGKFNTNYYRYAFPKKNLTNIIKLSNDIASTFSKILIDPFYLATINNQSDVLTKTPDKTMKIVYTLTEA